MVPFVACNLLIAIRARQLVFGVEGWRLEIPVRGLKKDLRPDRKRCLREPQQRHKLVGSDPPNVGAGPGCTAGRIEGEKLS